MSDLISREQAIKEIYRKVSEEESNAIPGEDLDVGVIVGLKMAVRIIKEQPSAEKTGHWENIDIIHDRKDAKITDWQQAQCFVCGKWHTTPYLYCINLDPYCPSCGARMVE